MNLTPEIKIFPGTQNQMKVGIMARATVYMNLGSETIAYFNQITVRQTKEGKWWVQWPAQEDSRGALNERGYPKSYPYYRVFPGDSNKAKRIQLEQMIVQKTQEVTAGGGPTAAPAQSYGVTAPPPPAPEPTAASAQDGLSWDLAG